jgi:orotate phosphoribosyltransferase
MALEDLKKLIKEKYLHTSKPVMRKCDCTHLIKGAWDSCETCGHPNSAHNTGICIATWEEGGYTLSSGKKSDKYFDIKGLIGGVGYDRHGNMLDKEIRTFIDHEGLYKKFESIGGTELGGALIAAMLCKSGHAFPVCFIRKSQRIHGLKKMIEGQPKSPILLVDDVLSTGNTIKEAIYTLKYEHYEISGILCVINRYGKDQFDYEFLGPETNSYPIYSLFKESDFE